MGLAEHLRRETNYLMAVTGKRSDPLGQLLTACISRSQSRVELWADFVQSVQVRRMAEIGVYQGQFAAEMLRRCECLTAYYMIDPWRHLNDWNKPANKDDAVFEGFFQEAKSKTEFAASKRSILRGRTTEVIERIADGELDFAYIDSDHTLKGIAIDLIRLYPKVHTGGFLGGDDFTRSVWQHSTAFEPTLVFPFAVYFAEAVGARIYALPFSQFCLEKGSNPQFQFVDLTGRYDHVDLRSQFTPKTLLKIATAERFSRLAQMVRKAIGRSRNDLMLCPTDNLHK